jgi:hypothetical protein
MDTTGDSDSAGVYLMKVNASDKKDNTAIIPNKLKR